MWKAGSKSDPRLKRGYANARKASLSRLGLGLGLGLGFGPSPAGSGGTRGGARQKGGGVGEVGLP